MNFPVPSRNHIEDLSKFAGDYIDKFTRFWNNHDNGILKFGQLFGGGFGTTVDDYASSPTLTDANQVVLVNSTAAVRTVTLPTAVGREGRRFTIKDWKGTAATNSITVDADGTETIDGATTYVMNTNYESVTVVSDNAGWSII